MNRDDILCEAPGPHGMTCTLPYGHKPENEHAFMIQLPPDLGAMMERILSDQDAKNERLQKEIRRTRWMFRLWVALFVFYATLTIVKIVVPS